MIKIGRVWRNQPRSGEYLNELWGSHSNIAICTQVNHSDVTQSFIRRFSKPGLLGRASRVQNIWCVSFAIQHWNWVHFKANWAALISQQADRVEDLNSKMVHLPEWWMRKSKVMMDNRYRFRVYRLNWICGFWAAEHVEAGCGLLLESIISSSVRWCATFRGEFEAERGMFMKPFHITAALVKWIIWRSINQ